MKKLICFINLLSISLIHASTLSTRITPSIPKEFTILHSSQPSLESNSQQPKTACFFYILISAPNNIKNNAKTKKEFAFIKNKETLYKLFSNITKDSQGAIIPKDFIKPGTPEINSKPTHALHFGWKDNGGKNNLTDAAFVFTQALTRLHLNFKKSHTCYYLIITEGRSGLLLNYATQHLKNEAFSLSAVVEIGTPLPTDKANKDFFYPKLSKIGTMYSFYTQHAYKLSNAVHFPASPQTSYPESFINKHTNLYNVRLLLNNNQRSLQNIFEGQDLQQPLAYLGQHIFEYCNLIKRSYAHHHDLWATIDTRTNNKSFIGVVSHPSGESGSLKAIKQEHQQAGKQLDDFQRKIGSSTDTRINMSDSAKMRSKVRTTAHLKKLQKLTCQAA